MSDRPRGEGGIYIAGQEAWDRAVMRRVRRRRRRRSRPITGRGLLGILAKSAKIGYQLDKRKDYRRMGAKGATGHCTRHHRPWEV